MSLKRISKKEAIMKAQNLCAYQEKCESDIRKKLYDWKANPDDFEDIIKCLVEDQFIDDERYAKAYAKEKFRNNKWGRIKIDFTLKKKNIPAEYIKIALEEIPEENYDLMLKNEIEKKLKGIKNTDEHTIKSKLIRFALSKGYENGKVFEVVSEILKNRK